MMNKVMICCMFAATTLHAMEDAPPSIPLEPHPWELFLDAPYVHLGNVSWEDILAPDEEINDDTSLIAPTPSKEECSETPIIGKKERLPLTLRRKITHPERKVQQHPTQYQIACDKCSKVVRQKTPTVVWAFLNHYRDKHGATMSLQRRRERIIPPKIENFYVARCPKCKYASTSVGYAGTPQKMVRNHIIRKHTSSFEELLKQPIKTFLHKQIINDLKAS